MKAMIVCVSVCVSVCVCVRARTHAFVLVFNFLSSFYFFIHLSF